MNSFKILALVALMAYGFFLNISGFSGNGIALPPRNETEPVQVRLCASPLALAKKGPGAYLLVPHLFLSVSGQDFKHATVGAVATGLKSPDVSKSYACIPFTFQRTLTQIHSRIQSFGKYNIKSNNCWHFALGSVF